MKGLILYFTGYGDLSTYQLYEVYISKYCIAGYFHGILISWFLFFFLILYTEIKKIV